MGLPTVSGIVQSQRRFVEKHDRPDLFCPVCTFYRHLIDTCPGSPEDAVRAKFKGMVME